MGDHGVDRRDRDQHGHVHQRAGLRLQPATSRSCSSSSATSSDGSSSRSCSSRRTSAATAPHRLPAARRALRRSGEAPRLRGVHPRREVLPTASGCSRRGSCWRPCSCAMPRDGRRCRARGFRPRIPRTAMLIVSVAVIGAATIDLHVPRRNDGGDLDRRHPAGRVSHRRGDCRGRPAARSIPGGWGGGRGDCAAPRASSGSSTSPSDLTRDYTFWSGVIGGAFLTTATHGTDQLMVQRYFCAASNTEARKALLWSGVVVFAQFVLFLLIGTMLFVYYTRVRAGRDRRRSRSDGRIQADRIFPYFIVRHLPPGIVGLVLAAIFAAAMSTLSSSLNSSAAAAVNDFYVPADRRPALATRTTWPSRVLTAAVRARPDRGRARRHLARPSAWSTRCWRSRRSPTASSSACSSSARSPASARLPRLPAILRRHRRIMLAIKLGTGGYVAVVCADRIDCPPSPSAGGRTR